jgi:hypothetical protein
VTLVFDRFQDANIEANLFCNLLVTVFSFLKLYQKEQKLLLTKGCRRLQILEQILQKIFNYKL